MIPIRTEAPVRYLPLANYVLIGTNVLAFFFFNLMGGTGGHSSIYEWSQNNLPLDTAAPRFHQFLTYQFLHANVAHLIGNMLFLWVFGNSVNSKMGDFTYALFYLSAGIFSGWGYFRLDPSSIGSTLVGASGAISGVTTAYLVLYPLSRVLVLYWFFIIGFLHIPAIALILVKIIFWDNVLSPQLEGEDHIAYSAHLSGYAFGFAFAMLLLLVRGVVRDHFDLLALWHRAYQRRAFQPETRPGFINRAAAATAPPRMARTAPISPPAPRPPSEPQRQADDLREDVERALAAGNKEKALQLYAEFMGLRPDAVLAERLQVLVGRAFYEKNAYAEAVSVFEAYLEHYPRALDRAEVGLLAGIILARDLGRPEQAEKRLAAALLLLPDGPRREQCKAWLESARAALIQPQTD